MCFCDLPAGAAVRQPVPAVQGREFRRRPLSGRGPPLCDDGAQGGGAAGVGASPPHRRSPYHHRMGHEAEAQKGDQSSLLLMQQKLGFTQLALHLFESRLKEHNAHTEHETIFKFSVLHASIHKHKSGRSVHS